MVPRNSGERALIKIKIPNKIVEEEVDANDPNEDGSSIKVR